MTWRCCVTAAWVDCSPTPTRPRRWGRSLRSFTFGHVRQLDAVASRFHRGPWLLQAGLGLRLLRGARPQRVARHGEHQGLGAGGRGPAAPEGIVRLPSRCRPARRRRPEDHRPLPPRAWCVPTQPSTATQSPVPRVGPANRDGRLTLPLDRRSLHIRCAPRPPSASARANHRSDGADLPGYARLWISQAYPGLWLSSVCTRT